MTEVLLHSGDPLGSSLINHVFNSSTHILPSAQKQILICDINRIEGNDGPHL